MTHVRRMLPVLVIVPALAAASVAISSASALDKPEAETGNATEVGATSAILQGRVKPRGVLTTYSFQYGTTKQYGQSTSGISVGLGTSWVSVASPVSGLAPNTTYHYRVVASNLLGTKQGSDSTFKTGAPGTPPVPGSSGSGSSGSGSGSSGSGSGSSGSGTSPGDDTSGSGSGDGSSGSGPSGSDDPSGVSSGDSTSSSSGPRLGSSVAVVPADGVVRVRLPGSTHYGALPENGTLPVGSVIDTTYGKVRLRSALGGGATQTATFWGGVFDVRQRRDGHGMTDINLHGAPDCPSGAVASAARRRRAPGLWGSDRGGRFRTHGRNSVATVRGTTWLTTERCHGTLTYVREGTVDVRARHMRRKVTVHQGHAFLAH